MEAVASALFPVMAFLVAYHLGPEWCILLNYQVVQGLMCEARKWDIREEQEAHKRTTTTGVSAKRQRGVATTGVSARIRKLKTQDVAGHVGDAEDARTED